MADPDPHELATPTLMRAARGVYAQSLRTELQAIGVDDLPRNGATLLAGLAVPGGPRPDLPAGLASPSRPSARRSRSWPAGGIWNGIRILATAGGFPSR
jgi:hypothetical protein